MPALCHEPSDTLATNKRKKDSAPENIWSRERGQPKVILTPAVRRAGEA